MRIVLAGVRGSTPAPGIEFASIGGNTSCVAIAPAGSDVPRLVLDAGTGIRAVTRLLDGAPFHGTILLSHLHWDHVQGLPFFAAADRDDAIVRLLLPEDGADAIELLGRAMSPPHFPIGPTELRGDWTFDTIGEGTVELERLTVTARQLPHKGGRTFGYRVTEGSRSVAYVPDHRPDPDGPGWQAALDLVADADTLIHDAQFVSAEADVAELYGHSTVQQAVELAIAARVRNLVLFHHSPTRTDDQIGRLVEDLAVPLRVVAGAEGDQIDL